MGRENWDDLRILLSIARAGTFAEAAKRLAVNESTVIRRLAQAEERFRARLFERNAGRLQPTDVGFRLLEKAEQVELQMQDLKESVVGTNSVVAGTVRLTSVPLIINHLLVPALPSLLSENPQLRIEMIAEARSLSLTKREADIAVRLARPRNEVRTLARRIGILKYGVYARAGCDPDGLRWITYEDRMSDLPQTTWINSKVVDDPESLPQILVNDAETLIACLLCGLGKTILPKIVGETQPGLVHLSEFECDCNREIWLLMHPELRQLHRVRVVTDWVATTLGF